jgi:2Fe-2S ferredoxin
MPCILFTLPDGTQKTVQAPLNWSLMQVAIAENIPGIEATCGGSMACATCHVILTHEWFAKISQGDNEQSEEEKDILEMAYGLTPTSRLACQIKITPEMEGLVVQLTNGSA